MTNGGCAFAGRAKRRHVGTSKLQALKVGIGRTRFDEACIFCRSVGESFQRAKKQWTMEGVFVHNICFSGRPRPQVERDFKLYKGTFYPSQVTNYQFPWRARIVGEQSTGRIYKVQHDVII